MPSSSADPATAGPSTTTIVGTTPEQSARALATRPQPSSEATPSAIPGTRRGNDDDERDAFDASDGGGVSESRRRLRRERGALRDAGELVPELHPDDLSVSPSSERTSTVAESSAPLRNERPTTVIVGRP